MNTVITGANRGIGLGLARKLSQQGHNVIGTSRDLNNVDELSQIARVIQLDVTDNVSVAAFAKELEELRIDVLVNNAGWLGENYPMSLEAQTIEDAAKSFDVNTLGSLRVLRALQQQLAGDAKIINISSRFASLTSLQSIDGPGYCMSKAALNMLTRQVSFDPTMQGRTIVSVSPGWVRTRMGGQNAHISVEESTAGIARLIARLQPDDTGQFFNYDGSTLPW